MKYIGNINKKISKIQTIKKNNENFNNKKLIKKNQKS